MITAMNSIQDMIDVNTIIGEPIETSNNIVIIPISKVSFGFAAGGSEFKGETIDEYTKRDKEEAIQYRLPFGGGSGAGVTINPIASLDKLLDYVPDLIEKTNNIMNRCMQNRKEETQKILKEMQNKHDKSMKKEEEDKKAIENKVEEVVEKVKKTKKPEKDEITYEFEYDETMEDE